MPALTDGGWEGWGVINHKGVLLVRTVSDTRRAAIINWLSRGRS